MRGRILHRIFNGFLDTQMKSDDYILAKYFMVKKG